MLTTIERETVENLFKAIRTLEKEDEGVLSFVEVSYTTLELLKKWAQEERVFLATRLINYKDAVRRAVFYQDTLFIPLKELERANSLTGNFDYYFPEDVKTSL